MPRVSAGEDGLGAGAVTWMESAESVKSDKASVSEPQDITIGKATARIATAAADFKEQKKES